MGKREKVKWWRGKCVYMVVYWSLMLLTYLRMSSEISSSDGHQVPLPFSGPNFSVSTNQGDLVQTYPTITHLTMSLCKIMNMNLFFYPLLSMLYSKILFSFETFSEYHNPQNDENLRIEAQEN